MIFEAKLIVILLFIITNFVVLLLVKTRINRALSFIFSYLLLALFLSLTVSSYENLKELMVVSAIYFAVILAIIFYYDPIAVEQCDKTKSEKFFYLAFIIPSSISLFLLVWAATFWITKNVSKTAFLVEERKIELRNEELFGSLQSSHFAVNTAQGIGDGTDVRKLRIRESQPYKTQDQFKMSAKKRARLKDQLSDNFLLKGSSHLMLILAATLSVLLLLSSKKSER